MNSARPIVVSGAARSPLNRRFVLTVLGMTGVSESLRAVERAAAAPKRPQSSSARIATAILPVSQSPSDFALPGALESVSFDPDAGFDLDIGGYRPTFIPQSGLFGPEGDAERLIREPLVVGMVITCLKDIWWIESEPRGERTFTITAYAAEHAATGSGRTALLTGEGAVTPDGGVACSLQTVSALARSDEHDLIISDIAVDRDGAYAGHVNIARGSSWKHGHGKCRKRCDQKSQGAKRRCHQRCRRRKQD